MHLIDSLTGGGAERSLVELLPELPAHGIAPRVVVLHDRAPDVRRDLEEEGIPVQVLEGTTMWRRARRLRAQLREDPPALLHTSLFEPNIIGRFAALGRPVPLLTSLVNTSYDPVRRDDAAIRSWRLRIVQAFDAGTARLAGDRFHAVSDAVRDAAIRDMGVRPERIAVVHRGRDRRRLGEPGPERRRRVRERLGIEESAFVLLHLGREEFQKGHDVLLAAMSQLLEGGTDAVLVLAGGRGTRSDDIDRTLEGFPPGRVLRLGFVEDVPDLLAAADVLAFPTRYEGFPGAVLEAMAMDVPVVASDIPPVREALGGTGRLVPPDSVDALAAALAELAAAPDERCVLVAAARRRFDAHFERGHITAAMAELFLRCAAGGGR